MKNWMLFFAVGLLAAPLIAADGSFPGVETLVCRTASLSYPELAVASTSDTDLVIWTSLSHLYGARVSRNGELIDEVPLELSTFGFYPSAASDGEHFLVMWADGPGEIGQPLSFHSRIVGPRGEPLPETTLVSNVYRRSRPSVTYADHRFAFAWLGSDHAESYVSFATIQDSALSLQTVSAPALAITGTYYRPSVIATASGAAAVTYPQVGLSTGCQTLCPATPIYGAVYRELALEGGALVDVTSSSPFVEIRTSEFVLPVLLQTSGHSMILWTTDEYIPHRLGGDTIRAMDGAAPDIAQSEVVFSSPLGDIAALGAAADDDDLWVAWIDRRPDRVPAEPWQLFIASVGADVTVYPSLQNATRLAMSSSRGHVAVAAFVPSEVGGAILLESISGPTRTRAVRR